MTLQLKPLLKQLTIKDKDNRLRPFDLDYIDPVEGDFAWGQRIYVREIENQYNAGKPVRLIVLKARQLGLSTVTEGVLFWWCFLHERSSNLVVSHQDGPAQTLFNMTKRFWDTFPYHNAFSTQYSTRRQLSWRETGSQIQVATAKNVEGVRGSTVTALHGSEVAFWPDPETLWTGLENTMPDRHGTFAALESTANGMGNWFHEQWLAAEAGESPFTPVFLPWWQHPEYRAHHQHVVSITAEEKEIVRMMEEKSISNDDCLAAIAWRRGRIRARSLDAFHQEYPSTPHEAFLMSGDNVFPIEAVTECHRPLQGAKARMFRTGNGTKVENDPSGRWTIYKKPSTIDKRPERYVVAGDPSMSMVGDYASIQVLDRQNLEQVAVFRGLIDPMTFAEEMMMAGYWYNTCILAPEAEGGGQAALGAIMKANYPFLYWHKSDAGQIRQSFTTAGWSTNYQRKRWAIGILLKMFLERAILIHDVTTFHELISYVYLENGEMGNGTGARHDDTVMALSIACAVSDIQPILPPYTDRQPQSRDIFTTDLESAFAASDIDGLPSNIFQLTGDN